MLFLSGLSLWSATLLLVVVPTLVAMCGTVLIRRLVGHEILSNNNEIAGFKFATVGVIYAVLLAFVVIVVWEKFAEAESAVIQEASASATLFRLTESAEPGMAKTRAAVSAYLSLAIEKDWPAMAQQKQSLDVTHALDALYAAALQQTDNGATRPAVLNEMFRQLDSLTQARRTRLHLATGIVPEVLWLTLFCGAIMTGILSALVFMGLLVIVSIDYPFTGHAIVGAEPLKAVLEDFGPG